MGVNLYSMEICLEPELLQATIFVIRIVRRSGKGCRDREITVFLISYNYILRLSICFYILPTGALRVISGLILIST